MYGSTGNVLYDGGLCRRAHRLTVLIIFSMVLVYVALWEGVTYDSDYNTKRFVLSLATLIKLMLCGGLFYCCLFCDSCLK